MLRGGLASQLRHAAVVGQEPEEVRRHQRRCHPEQYPREFRQLRIPVRAVSPETRLWSELKVMIWVRPLGADSIES